MKQNYSFLAMLLFFSSNIISAKLNQFGISDIIPPTHISFTATQDAIEQRIAEEMNDNLTLQDILDFIPKIEKYIDHLLDTNDYNAADIQDAKLAVQDVEKAKKMLKINQVDPDGEHDLRIALRHVASRARSLQAKVQ